jgi:spore germination protein KB
MAIWIDGTFIKMGLYHYVLVLSTAQWFYLSDYKPLALPYGLLLTLFGIWLSPNVQEQALSFTVTTPFLKTILFIFIPVSLLLISLIKNRNHQKYRT